MTTYLAPKIGHKLNKNDPYKNPKYAPQNDQQINPQHEHETTPKMSSKITPEMNSIIIPPNPQNGICLTKSYDFHNIQCMAIKKIGC